ncbi:uncharacterized protein F4812DRAFT_464115 [Daldinia caldariorum]|uniref:uncharacterized protein n=1 Tax=Daldinia caldariorum TaxID=326644 RepID=UPI0020076DF6|nr:uncharacterized protein F4812DRAFT_464115 [Daldinia caldariorum]KAI1462996.1 hypothetical protein F4812DRAFT_464115 [Daldinia caldariorum]
MAHCYLDAFPGNEYLYYLANEDIHKELGAPVNHTDISNTVGKAFSLTGDYARRDPNGYLKDIARLLDLGIQVAMIHGDRDFACNWIGGERVSPKPVTLLVVHVKKAGYADVTIDDSTPVGQVRQHNLFSFTRVYQFGYYSTNGLPTSTTTLKPPPLPLGTCYLRGMASTCAENQIEAIKDGSASIYNGVIVSSTSSPDLCPDLVDTFSTTSMGGKGQNED